MITRRFGRRSGRLDLRLLAGLLLTAVVVVGAWKYFSRPPTTPVTAASRPPLNYEPRRPLDTGGFKAATTFLPPWGPDATLQEISTAWQRVGYRTIERIDRQMAGRVLSAEELLPILFLKAMLCNYEGEPEQAYAVVEELRSQVEKDDIAAQQSLYSIIYFQGVTALRRGENENCILCRGESSCILPDLARRRSYQSRGIATGDPAFYRIPGTVPRRSRSPLAAEPLVHDAGRVSRRGRSEAFLISIERFAQSEFDIGRFRDIGHLVGVNRLNQGGGGLMDDFDNDGLLDIVAPTWDATCPMALLPQ